MYNELNTSKISKNYLPLKDNVVIEMDINKTKFNTKLYEFKWIDYILNNDAFTILNNVVIPASVNRNSVLPHIFLKSNYFLINKNFPKVLSRISNMNDEIKYIEITKLATLSVLGVFFSQINSGDIIYFKLTDKIQEEILLMLEESLKNYSITIPMGKSINARKCTIDLPPFTGLFIEDSFNYVHKKITECIDVLIELTLSEKELIQIEISEYANMYGLLLTNDTLEYLVTNLRNKNVKSILKLLSDYLYLHPKFFQPLDIDELNAIFESLMIRKANN